MTRQPVTRRTSTPTTSDTPAREAAGGRSALHVQLRAATYTEGRELLAPANDPNAIHRVAERGVSGGGGGLPHAAAIQASFGRHDISSVSAHVGGDAAPACASIGARGYATGQRVAFGEAPDLHLAAHEAAHVVQQRAGVQLSGGVGASGDRYEQHADRVADAVVAGRSAEGLLDEVAGGGGPSGVQRRAVQRDGDEQMPSGFVVEDREGTQHLSEYPQMEHGIARSAADRVEHWQLDEIRDTYVPAINAAAEAWRTVETANASDQLDIEGAREEAEAILSRLNGVLSAFPNLHNDALAAALRAELTNDALGLLEGLVRFALTNQLLAGDALEVVGEMDVSVEAPWFTYELQTTASYSLAAGLDLLAETFTVIADGPNGREDYVVGCAGLGLSTSVLGAALGGLEDLPGSAGTAFGLAQGTGATVTVTSYGVRRSPRHLGADFWEAASLRMMAGEAKVTVAGNSLAGARVLTFFAGMSDSITFDVADTILVSGAPLTLPSGQLLDAAPDASLGVSASWCDGDQHHADGMAPSEAIDTERETEWETYMSPLFVGFQTDGRTLDGDDIARIDALGGMLRIAADGGQVSGTGRREQLGGGQRRSFRLTVTGRASLRHETAENREEQAAHNANLAALRAQAVEAALGAQLHGGSFTIRTETVDDVSHGYALGVLPENDAGLFVEGQEHEDRNDGRYRSASVVVETRLTYDPALHLQQQQGGPPAPLP